MKIYMDRELAKVWTISTVTFAALDWSAVEIILKCILTLTVIGYSARKWYFAEQDRKAGKPFGTQIIEKD